MIKIEERIPSKLPGKSSLFISFEYNKLIVETIKTFSNCIYDKKTQTWECPVTIFSELIKKLAPIDEIKISTLGDEHEDSFTKYELSNFKTRPYDYQLDGIQYGLNHDKWLLLDAPGLGKSLQVIYLAEELQKRKGIEHCLIICGVNTLKANWKKEINRHSKLSCHILGEYTSKSGKILYGGTKERLEQLKKPIDEFFIITNIETLRDESIVKELNSGCNKIDMIAFDECHTAKSPQAQQSHGLMKLTNAKYKIAMTGTLIVNNPLDAYVPLKWIGADNSTYTNFKYYYCEFGGPFNNILKSFKNTKVLKDQIDSCSLRRTKDLLSLPEKTIINEEVELNPDQDTFYTNIKNGIVEQADKVKITTTSLLAMLTRLRQAISCPSALTTENISSSKVDRACELVEQIISNNDKVVIFSTFKETLNKLYDRLKEHNPLLCTGDVNDSIISENIDKFQTDDKYKIILATTQKLGVGVTLTSASYAIFVDSTYTAATNEQCEDRVHRIGSKKPVFIYYLWNTNTVDERVREIVEDKSMISDYVIDDKCSPQMFDKLKQIIIDL